MTSALLVLFMTLPGLALFYGGLVRTKNVLSVVAQCFGIAGLVTILWWAIGYSFAFSEGRAFLGGTGFAFFKGVDNGVGQGAPYGVKQRLLNVPDDVCDYHSGAHRRRDRGNGLKFSSVLVFVAIWMFAVYFPLAHMVWGPAGFMNGTANFDKAGIKAIDFAGGTVVAISSGWSALVLAIILANATDLARKPSLRTVWY